MRFGMTSNTWKIACFFLISSCKIIEIQAFVMDTFLTVSEGVQKFYLTPSTYFVFDEHDLGFEKERTLLELIRNHSSRNIMSQTITFEDLKRLSDRRENTLYTLLIRRRENLEHAINVTKDTNMSIHPWLLYVSKNVEFDCNNPGENFFNLRMDTWMAASCVGDTTLKVYHSVIRGQTEVVDMAVWSANRTKLDFTGERGVIKSYIDLKGMTLRLAAKLNRSILTDDMKDNIAKFNYELIDEIANLSNFKTEVVAVESALGYRNRQTKKWYGMMKLMEEKVADIGLALFTLSHRRMTVVDYAIPLAKGRGNFYVKLPEDTEVLWSTYFKVYNKYSWTAMGVSILIFSILIYLLKNGFRRLSIQLFSDDFLKIWGIFSMQSPNDTSSGTYIRIIYFSILFTSLILNAIYSASITSVITALSPELPFKSYSEFLRDKSYELIVVKGSREHGIILSQRTDWTSLKWRLKPQDLLPNHSYQGFQQACNDKVAYLTDEVNYRGNQNYLTCKLGSVSIDRVDYMSFVMTKNNPYLKVMNLNILRLMDYGILNRLRQKYFQKYNEICNMKPNVITLKEIWSIIIIWAVGLTFALTGLILEIIIFRYSLRVSSTRKTRINSFRQRRIVNDQSWLEKQMKLRNYY